MPELKVRVNGADVSDLRVQHVMLNGELTVELEIVVNVVGLGWLTLDDNNLWDAALSKFIIECDSGHGWKRTTVKNLILLILELSPPKESSGDEDN